MVEEKQGNIDTETAEPTRDPHWAKVLFYTHSQFLLVYGALLVFTEAYLLTTLFTAVLITLGVLGLNAGAHRLWAHKSYTASTGLKVFFMLCQTLAGQGSIYNWVLNHRLHHQHFSTKQDPFNPNKGFFYSHFLSQILKPTPEQVELAKDIDMSDLENDDVVMFQKKYYWILCLAIFIFLPVYIPMAYWKESFVCSLCVAGWMRYGITLHFAWLIHSSSIIFGLQKGEKFPSDTNMIFLLYKTYWLQYHYITPWDYQTSEYGKYGSDCVTMFIRVCAALELASNLRTTDSLAVQNALYMAMETKKPIAKCLLEVEANGNIPQDHYLDPKKYY